MKIIFREKLQIEKTEKGFHITTDSDFHYSDLEQLINLLNLYLKFAECESELKNFTELDDLDF